MLRLTFLLFILVFSTKLHTETICISPLCHKLEAFINPKRDVSDVHNDIVFFRLKEALENAGYQIDFIMPKNKNNEKMCREAKAILVFGSYTLDILRALTPYKNKSFLFVFEPPIITPHLYNGSLLKYCDKIFVTLDSFVDNKNYFKFFYPQPRLKMIQDVVDFSDKKLCTLIAGNIPKMSSNAPYIFDPNCLYLERKKIISFFERLNTKEFDLYGLRWEGQKSWKGTISDKWVVLNKYKFCICYENSKDQTGYVTEKIFDCFNGGCVPVYWGASNILDYVPKECFIDRRIFSSNEELYYYLKTMDRTTYEGYLVAIHHYLESPEAKLFSIDNFISIIMSNISQLKQNQ